MQDCFMQAGSSLSLEIVGQQSGSRAQQNLCFRILAAYYRLTNRHNFFSRARSFVFYNLLFLSALSADSVDTKLQSSLRKAVTEGRTSKPQEEEVTRVTHTIPSCLVVSVCYGVPFV